MTLAVTPDISLADWEISETFVRASGPGGQNVNKVSTAVELRFAAAASPNLTPPVKARLRRLAGRRWNDEGVIVLSVQDTRSQARNREIARERLAALIAAAAIPPRPRIATRPTLASKRRRLDAKRHRGDVKVLRGGVEE